MPPTDKPGSSSLRYLLLKERPRSLCVALAGLGKQDEQGLESKGASSKPCSFMISASVSTYRCHPWVPTTKTVALKGNPNKPFLFQIGFWYMLYDSKCCNRKRTITAICLPIVKGRQCVNIPIQEKKMKDNTTVYSGNSSVNNILLKTKRKNRRQPWDKPPDPNSDKFRKLRIVFFIPLLYFCCFIFF